MSLHGVSGSLVSGAVLEEAVATAWRETTEPHRRAAITRLHRWWSRVGRAVGPASSVRAVLDVAVLPLMELLGYRVAHLEPHGDGFAGVLGGGRSPVVVLRTTAWGVESERAWRDTVRAGRSAGARWGFVCTGSHLRVIDASRSWSRRALEFDLADTMSDERSATAFWALIRRETLDATPGPSALERTIDQSDRHTVAVCTTLREGVFEALAALIGGLAAPDRRGAPPHPEPRLEQAITIVYRMLFLLFAEARTLVPVWHRVYRDAYTMDALCQRSIEGPDPRGLWTTLQAMSRLAHAGCRAGDLTVTAFNGRLFSPRHTPLAEHGTVPDAAVQRAVLALATAPAADGRHRISYADLGVEQLGAVYERVLEYEPAPTRGPEVLVRTSHERKATGSFYTPRAMTEFLVRRTLHPLVEGRSAEEILKLRVVDPAMGSGAFLVAACRYLAGAAERSLIDAGEWVRDNGVRARRAELRRTVAQRCLYGVDLNPMAVQLARLSLWLTTLAAGRPLTFLDHHLAAGDSLIGAGLADLARRPPGGRARRAPLDTASLPLFDADAAGDMAMQVLPERFRLAAEASDTAAAVHEKERALAALLAPSTPLARWKAAADLWCAGWFWRDGVLSTGVYQDVVSSLVDGSSSLAPRQLARVMDTAADIARQHRFFHWELEFPEVFFDDEGRRGPAAGFDAVLGNPPWDMLRADTGDRAAREQSRPDRAARLRFFRDAGVYRTSSGGHANRYQLFAERALHLTRPGGRVGLILPSGLATDHGSGDLRRTIFDAVAIDCVFGFENRARIFPIHRDVKFLLLSGTAGGRTERLRCSFGHATTEWLEQLPDAATEDVSEARPVVITRGFIEMLDPQQMTFPLLSNTTDLAMLAHAMAVAPRLDDPCGWHALFGRELNATEDRPHFVERSRQPAPGHLTVVEGKHLEPFRVRTEESTVAVPRAAAAALMNPARTFARCRIAYRDVASATNRLTIIAAMLTPDVISTHTLYCLKTMMGETSQYCLLALLNSLVANYLVRLQVTTHVTTAVMARLRVPRPGGHSPAFCELARLARSIERTGTSDIDAYARLNAIAARLYQLSTTQYEHVVSTFPLLPAAVRRACLRAYEPSALGRDARTR
jgi:hypothetical protein